MSRSDAAALMKLAESIADGSSIDWEAAEASASADDKPVIRQLRILSNLAVLHRSMPAASMPGAGSTLRRATVSPAIGHWAHLTLLERLGGGAFADVYRAWDRHLEREVALKLLRVDESADDLDSSRIANEGRLLARVRHANVITVHGVDAHDNRVGLWMDLVRGKTLEQQLASHGPFSAREAGAIGLDLCRALAAIHAAGLIHRDIKAQNVMREDGGRIVLMDLGTGREADARVAGGVPELAGTPLYLAPEIFTGAPASPRTDVYSLGVLLYRLVTGSFPVRAATLDELKNAHADGVVVRLRDARADLPTPFVRVVDRAIAPEPAKRYQSAGELEADLADALAPASTSGEEARRRSRFQRLTAWPVLAIAVAAIIVAIGLRAAPRPQLLGAAPMAIQSIAVLPLANLSGDASQDYFADGMTDELIGVLGQLRAVNVISRTSAMRFKGSRQALPDIARALHADALIEGSVLMIPGGSGASEARRVRVNARLVYAGTDTVIWDRTFEARAADVFALRGDILKAITEGIHANLAAPLRPHRAQTFEAFDLYLKGRYYWNQRTEQGLKQSVQYFETALQQSPDYALAYAGLADAYNLLGFYGYLPVNDAYDRASSAADRALALDETIAEAHASRGFLHISRFEWDLAEDSYRRAIGLNPGYATARQWYGYLLSQRGRAAEAVDQLSKAVALDPLSAIVNAAYGSVLIFARRYDDAIAQLQRTLQLDPNLPRSRVELANALLQKGDLAGALASADRAAAVAGRDATVSGDIGYIDARAGRRSDAVAIAGELADRYTHGELSAAMPLAIVYTGLGAFDDAFDWMDRARQEYGSDIGGIMVDPRLDPLRSDPRYGKLLAAVGLAQ